MGFDVDESLAAGSIFGVNVEVLDRLTGLRTSAAKEEISFHEWQARDAELRQGLPALSGEDLAAADRAVAKHYVEDLDRSELYRTLMSRLSSLQPPPSEEELFDELGELHKRINDKKQRSERQLWAAAAARISRWLRELGNVDPVSGLPWAAIAKFREIDDPDLGPVPLLVDRARELAWGGASEPQRERAQMLAADPRDRWQASRASMAELLHDRLTFLPRALIRAAQPATPAADSAELMLNAWRSPGAQAILWAETSSGWPAEYA